MLWSIGMQTVDWVHCWSKHAVLGVHPFKKPMQCSKWICTADRWQLNLVFSTESFSGLVVISARILSLDAYDGSTFFREPGTSSLVGMQNHPTPTHHAWGATHAHLECESLPRLMHHAGCLASQLHSQWCKDLVLKMIWFKIWVWIQCYAIEASTYLNIHWIIWLVIKPSIPKESRSHK